MSHRIDRPFIASLTRSTARRALPLLAGALATGCYGAAFTPTDTSYAASPHDVALVQLATERPASGYAEAGILTGTDISLEGALTRIKVEAAMHGCDLVVLLGEAIEAHRGWTGSKSHVRASCYVRSGSSTTSADVPAGEPTLPPSKTPKGAAGFAFGEKLDDARAACVAAHREWTAAGDGGQCSGGVQDTGFAGPVDLTACDAQVCAIDIDATPPQDESAAWSRAFGDVRRILLEKYGAPRYDLHIPGACSDSLVSCVRDGRARATVTWRWSAVAIELRLEAGNQGQPHLHIQYKTLGGLGTSPKMEAL